MLRPAAGVVGGDVAGCASKFITAVYISCASATMPKKSETDLRVFTSSPSVTRSVNKYGKDLLAHS